MAKKIPIQKKKTLGYSILIFLIKILSLLLMVILGILIFNKLNMSSIFDFSDSTKNKQDSRIPAQLKWYDDFKGIENVPDQKAKGKANPDGSQNFLQYESSKNKK